MRTSKLIAYLEANIDDIAEACDDGPASTASAVAHLKARLAGCSRMEKLLERMVRVQDICTCGDYSWAGPGHASGCRVTEAKETLFTVVRL